MGDLIPRMVVFTEDVVEIAFQAQSQVRDVGGPVLRQETLVIPRDNARYGETLRELENDVIDLLDVLTGLYAKAPVYEPEDDDEEPGITM